MKSNGIIKGQRVSADKLERSREFRKDMTGAERVFWDMVRNRKLFGLKFRRQQVIDGFIVDFYCDSIGLCVEIDGPYHKRPDAVEYDLARSEVLTARGLDIIRFTNEEILEDNSKVIQAIEYHLDTIEKQSG